MNLDYDLGDEKEKEVEQIVGAEEFMISFVNPFNGATQYIRAEIVKMGEKCVFKNAGERYFVLPFENVKWVVPA